MSTKDESNTATTKDSILDKFFTSLIHFIFAINHVFPKCQRTDRELLNLRLIKSSNLHSKKAEHARNWYSGMSPVIIDKCQARDAGAIHENKVPLLNTIQLSEKWENIDQECVWDHLERINRLASLYCESKDNKSTGAGGASPFSGMEAASQMASGLMSNLGIEQHADGRVSMNFKSVSDFVAKNVTQEQINSIASSFGSGDGGFGTLIQQGLGAFTRNLANGPDLPAGTRVVESLVANPDESPSSEESDGEGDDSDSE